MILQEQQEAKKVELEELKERKKKQLEAKKINQIEIRKRKHEQKLERQIIKKRKQEEREKQQKEKELKKNERQECRKGKLSVKQVNKGHGLGSVVGEGSTLLTSLPEHHQIVGNMFDNMPQGSNPLTPLLEHQQIANLHSTPTTPLPKHHQILRDMYNILTPTYAALQNIQATASHSPPHSPIRQLKFVGLLDENIFGHTTPFTLEVDYSSANNPITDSPVEVPEPFPSFMLD